MDDLHRQSLLSEVEPSTYAKRVEASVAVKRFGILDTPAEEDFDAVTRLLASICDVPISLIGFYDTDRFWFKSTVGVSSSESPLEKTISSFLYSYSGGPFVVSDASSDERFSEFPSVRGEPFVRFYAGMPLLTNDGCTIGVVCVADSRVREITRGQIDALEIASRVVMALIDRRATAREADVAKAAQRLTEAERLELVSQLNKARELAMVLELELRTANTRRTSVEERLSYAANFDTLTRLPNRSQFMAMLENAFTSVSAGGQFYQNFAVFFIGIDAFKQINDSFTISGGDNLLLHIGVRLLSLVSKGDIVARVGGDEFAIVRLGSSDVHAARLFYDKIKHMLSVPWRMAGIDCIVTASVGIVLVDGRYARAHDVVRDATVAMHNAKEQGRDRCSFFHNSLRSRFEAKAETRRGLLFALARNEFKLAYQPIIAIGSGRVEGFEALLRWQHSFGELIKPIDFISVAEESTMIVELGAWALREACLQLRNWRREVGTLHPLQMSVNVSARQLNEVDFASLVKRTLREFNVSPGDLALELTESAMLIDPTLSLSVLGELRDLGIGIHLDDFGTGYSSLSYLRRLPVTRVKIDRSFVSSDFSHDQGLVDPVIVGAIISLAHQLNLSVVAEGVETTSQRQGLEALGCDAIQGYLISQPMAGGDAVHHLRQDYLRFA